MFKKLNASLLVITSLLILSFVFTACAPAVAPAAEVPAAAEPAAEEEATEEETAAEEPAAPVEKEVVKVAFITPLTGPHALMGKGGLNSFTLAINNANEDPDSKYTFEVVAIDDECKPEVGVQAALLAASNPEIVASVGHYCSMVAISTADTFHNSGLANIVWGAVLPAITYGNDYKEISRVNGTMHEQNDAHARYMKEVWNVKTVSIIHDTTDYGEGWAESFKNAADKYGIEILSSQGVLLDQSDFTVELTKIKSEAPDALYMGVLADLGALIRNQMIKLGLDDINYDGTSGSKNQAFIEALGAENAEGCIAWLDGPPIEELPGGREFLDAYAAAGFKEPPEAYGPFAYVGGQIVTEAINAVGPDRAALIEYINTTNIEDTIIGPVIFNEYGQNEIPLASPYVIQDGEYVYWPNSEYASGVRKLPKDK